MIIMRSSTGLFLLMSLTLLTLGSCGRKASLDAPPHEVPPYPRTYPKPF